MPDSLEIALELALELATRQHDAGRKVLHAMLVAQQAARARLEQLQDYARDTESRWGMQADTTRQPEVLYHQHWFMARLGEAVRMQTGLLDAQSDRVADARGVLLAAQLRLSSLRQLMERRRRQLAQQQRRMEQKQTDEWVVLRYRSAPPGIQEQEH